ncbi:acetyl-CoA hydrolase/transferase C-terminal domain-containing protein [Anaerococcus hydrogenalis]|uniref:Probable butyrate:acetyl-CoA coenzyme A-transferase n=1 Tax=Anaerococcus hydrogenalis TaxID=33029 RepID=A0A2N6UJZ0_9FIRM|nr:acetyl-CoA hydrolase/transferase C-terminal domain-containing protein [Anaerococcus hydrogenalis]MDK7694118.1 acetyl-CoA hydrolase/transferase C-terminal domain-containing protein [Anaerococcus hydrogenalis]MDK7695896.1 acetyl-CoA hydrolase/transferase C-terminal domain-containing protein [Anaerococcus hydrogenalis]MDK7707145.1 acetyl-CoA hydrolase/transferase C-terminal domain-containing protein [Anaerococcus hydrogenalis]PMC82173.1 butyryl-CoA:acetate CoA-transferase [Anaerococcus hydrogen
MDYNKIYKQKLISAKEAAKLVKSGDYVDYSWGVLAPHDFDEAFAKEITSLNDIVVRGGVELEKYKIFDSDEKNEHFVYNSWHSLGVIRKLAGEGRAFYSPLKYSELPKYYRTSIRKPNVFVTQASPMDEHGYFNFGVSASHLYAAIENSDIVIIEVNKKVPRGLGGYENCVHIKEVDYIIEGSNPEMIALGKPQPSDLDKEVAKFVVEELVDGACLQIGIGGLPTAIGNEIAKSDLKDLGVHTEMYVDSFVELSKAGIITGKKKNIDRGRQVYAFAAGSKELYDFIDNNEELCASPVDYCNGIEQISALDNFMSINSALEIDLNGTVSAESSGIKHISGSGGALDFMLGAYNSKGGKSFVTLHSSRVDKKGKRHSNIVPTLIPGTQPTGCRANTHYIVTEYGMVNLKGQSLWERTEKLISIAHPEFRDELIKEAEKMRIWRKSNK